MTIPKIPAVDLSMVTSALSGRKAASVAAGFAAALAVAVGAPERWAGLQAAVAGYEMELAVLLLGGSAWASARRTADGKRKVEDINGGAA